MQHQNTSNTFLNNFKAILPFFAILVMTVGGYFFLSYSQNRKIEKLKFETQSQLDSLSKEEVQRKADFKTKIERLKNEEKTRQQQYAQVAQDEEKAQSQWKQSLQSRRLQEDREWSREIDSLREAYKREQFQIAQMREQKRREEENRRAALQAQTERERQQNAHRFAERAKNVVVSEVYDGGQDIAVSVRSWQWLGDGYRIDMYISWNGSFIRSNSYSAEGYITCNGNGKNVEWTQTWVSNSVKKYMKNRNIWASVLVSAVVLSNID